MHLSLFVASDSYWVACKYKMKHVGSRWLLLCMALPVHLDYGKTHMPNLSYVWDTKGILVSMQQCWKY